MEPLLPSEGNTELEDLAFALAQKSSSLSGMLQPKVQASIGDLVRSMNCYYSNLIEGHNTLLKDINRALANDYSSVPEKRALQREAAAHIAVQEMIDRGQDPPIHPASRDYIIWLHQAFCERLPDEMLWIQNPDTQEKVKRTPGQLRARTVIIGQHVPPLPENLGNFLTRFEEAYASTTLSKATEVIAAAAAHHRLLWIHPFDDGNGRVTRLMSYAMLLRQNIGGPLWSVARGLARNREEYQRLLAAADEPRDNDLDGRGTLSQRALIEFCRYFLRNCIDQVEFMTTLLQPAELQNRIRVFIEEEIGADRLPKGSFNLLREGLLAGEFDRGRAPELTGYKERRARDILAALIKRRMLVSDGPKMPVRLGFPEEVIERWFPRLYQPSLS